MEIEKLIDLVNEHMRDAGSIGFPKIVDKLPEKMKPQRSDIPEVKTEWVWQSRDLFDCYHGEIAFELQAGRWLMFGFYG